MAKNNKAEALFFTQNTFCKQLINQKRNQKEFIEILGQKNLIDFYVRPFFIYFRALIYHMPETL